MFLSTTSIPCCTPNTTHLSWQQVHEALRVCITLGAVLTATHSISPFSDRRDSCNS
jgi:hypothetical protein